MNNKTYANYLMHGRTKGSRNGISTTKGYTAVGQKAKGKLINGKYVYANNNENTQSGIVVKPTSNNWQQQAALEQWKKQNQNAIAAKKKKAEAFDKASQKGGTNDWQRAANAYRSADEHVNMYAQKRMKDSNENFNALNAALDKYTTDGAHLRYDNSYKKASNKQPTNIGASQSADLARWKQQNRNNIAAKKTAEAKAQAAKDAAWNAKVQVAKKPTNIGASQAGNTARAMKEYMTKASANRKAQTQAAKQPTNIGASQSADLARWAQQNRNNIAASKKAALKEELHRNAALSKYTTKDWQNRANIARANTEVRNKVVSGESNKGYTPYAEPGRVSNGIANEKTRNLIRLENLQNRVYAEQNKKAQEATEKAKQSASYNKMSSTQKNAMQNDPRYSKDSVDVYNYEKSEFLGRPITESKSKNGPLEAVTTKDYYMHKVPGGGKAPYADAIAKARSTQEYAAAVAKQKAFDNAYKESRLRNSRSDLGNALADAKEDAKNAFKSLKNKFKKKKKK